MNPIGVPAMKRECLGSMLSVCAVFALNTLLLAGPLTPPVGPVAPTQKPLAEIEPRTAINSVNTPGDAQAIYRITQPGSYYLTGNISGQSGKSAIIIDSGNVTVDLMGFALQGSPGSLHGIGVGPGTYDSLTVRNGVISQFGGYGVQIGPIGLERGALVENLHVSGNGAGGIMSGASSVIRLCTAIDNGGAGIAAANNSIIESCSAYQNAIDGISIGAGGTVAECSAQFNGASGISAASIATITGCTVLANTGVGIGTVFGATITGCMAGNNQSGGIATTTGATITGCTARQNTGAGIQTGASATITGCSAFFNTGDGLRISDNSTVLGCTSEGNTVSAAGIKVIGTNNRVEGNNCVGNDVGIDADNAGNFISRNTCSNNSTNWDIAAGNACLVVLATGAGPISGDSGGSSPGSTDPNANYTY